MTTNRLRRRNQVGSPLEHGVPGRRGLCRYTVSIWRRVELNLFRQWLPGFFPRQWCTEGGVGGSTPPPEIPKFWQSRTGFQIAWKIINVLISLKIAEFRTPAPQNVRKKGSKILKLPRFAIVTFAMTNKLVVIINSHKVPKIKKILLYEMKFLVQNYSSLQNPWLGGYRPQIPVLSVLCFQLNLLNPPARTKLLGTPLFPGHRAAGAWNWRLISIKLWH